MDKTPVHYLCLNRIYGKKINRIISQRLANKCVQSDIEKMNTNELKALIDIEGNKFISEVENSVAKRLLQQSNISNMMELTGKTYEELIEDIKKNDFTFKFVMAALLRCLQDDDDLKQARWVLALGGTSIMLQMVLLIYIFGWIGVLLSLVGGFVLFCICGTLLDNYFFVTGEPDNWTMKSSTFKKYFDHEGFEQVAKELEKSLKIAA